MTASDLSTEQQATAAMSYLMRCKHCYKIHDAMGVTVLQRYSDCSVWKCPNCGHVGDDRPLSWGGSFERVTAEMLQPERRYYLTGEFGGQS